MEKGVAAFNRDVLASGGYLYSDTARLSSVLATRRLTDAMVAVADFRGKRVLDIGCGDGTYTLQLFDQAAPASIHGVDHAAAAIDIARTRVGDRPITYAACSAEALPFADDSFDVAQLRGVLHHVDRPVEALREAMRVAPTVVVAEPNGYNPVLKVLEKVSRYHIEHEERSFFPFTLHGWAKELGGTVRSATFIGLVPFFCPDPLARTLKAIEPVVERVPFVRGLTLGTEVFVVERRRSARA